MISYKRKQLGYLDMLIIICERVCILLEHSMPDTEEILSDLMQQSSLKSFDFSLKYICTDDKKLSERVKCFFSSIGKYDAATQIMLANEFGAECRMLKEKYQQQYDKHHKLYLSFGVLSGLMLSLMII